MKKPISIAFIFSFLTFSVSLFAATNSETFFYLEPRGGGGAATSKVSADSLTLNGSSRASNVMGGANMGWRTDYIHVLLGVDYNHMSFSSGSAGIVTYGVGLGYEWNLPLITTIMLKGGSTSVSGNNTAATNDPMFGASIGVGYFLTERGGAKISLEYTFLHQSGSIEIPGTTVGTVDKIATNIDVGIIGASLSFPIDIDYPTEWWRTGIKR